MKRCNLSLMYPVDNGKWIMIICPLQVGHDGLHADENLYPFFTTEDAKWYEVQYRLCNA